MTSSTTGAPSSSTSARAPSCALTNALGEYLVYRHPQYGFRFSANPRHARRYRGEKGAKIARSLYRHRDAYALTVVPLGA